MRFGLSLTGALVIGGCTCRISISRSSIPQLIARKVHNIMAHDDKILNRVKNAQQTVFRQCDASLKAIAYDSGIGYTTLQTYARGEAGMSVAAMHKLAKGGVPTALLSLLLPDGFQIVEASEDYDHDKLAEGFHDYMKTKTDAHRPESPAGRELSDCEKQKLDNKIVQLPLRGKVA